MNDETLTLYFFNDGLSAAERLRVQKTLENDESLRAQYAALCADLTQLGVEDPKTVDTDTKARWHDSIDRAARLEQQQAPARERTVPFASFAWGTAAVAALVVGIGIGTYYSGTRVPDLTLLPGVAELAAPDARSPTSPFERGFEVHLRDSRQELAGLATDTEGERALLIRRMLQQNRLFERAADKNDAKDLARVLRAFEPILMRLADDDITAAEAHALQAQLAFELNVMLTKLGRNTSEETGPI